MFVGRPDPLIVGSVGPYGASLHDASEYSGSYAATTSPETMREWHRPRIDALVESGVDLLALETIPCRIEAEMLVELIREYPDLKAWLSFSCNVRKTNRKDCKEKCEKLNVVTNLAAIFNEKTSKVK